jgi:hypothetical protein
MLKHTAGASGLYFTLEWANKLGSKFPEEISVSIALAFIAAAFRFRIPSGKAGYK